MADSSIWPNVVTGVATLAAGLGTTGLTLHNNRKRAVLEQQDRLRADQRQVVVDLLHIGHEWAHAADSLLLYVARVSDQQQVSDSEYATTYSEAQAEFRRRLVTARVVVTEPGVAAAVRVLSGLYDEMPKLFTKVLRGERDHRGIVTQEMRDQAYGMFLRTREQLAAVERAALERFSQPPARRTRRWLRPWRRLSAKRKAPAEPIAVALVQSGANGETRADAVHDGM